MITGQLIASGQLTYPKVNFASVHSLTSVTVHMNFSLPRGNFERRVTRCTTLGNRLCQGNFCKLNTEQFLRIWDNFAPPPGEFDHHFLLRKRELDKKLPRWPEVARSKKFSRGLPGGCTKLELTET